MHEIPLENIQPGDLLFWPGHVGMYIGGDRYCHSTAKAGSDGFIINSLNPEHPDFRADLKEKITAVGSYF
jgi:cell wall-associated NlpC family hydrolase